MGKWFSVTMLGALLVGASSAVGVAEPAKTTFQSVAMHDFETGEELNGAGLLWRTRHEIWANLSATGLDPQHGYTVWWVIFNNPAECIGGCGSDDLEAPTVDPAVFYAGGFVSPEDGMANVSVHLTAGEIPQDVDVLIPGRPDGGGNGLNQANGFDAEVHLILRSHQPVSDGDVDEQIGSFAGLCGEPPDFPNCEDQQAVAFLPNSPE